MSEGIQVIEGVSIDPIGSGIINASINASESWAMDSTGGAYNTSLGGAYTSLLVGSIIPHAEMVNPNLIYQGNSRYLNDYGAQITVKGLVFGNCYLGSLLIATGFRFAAGIWDGFAIVPDLATAVNMGDIRRTTQDSSASGKVFSYELVVPDGAVFGLAIQRYSGTGVILQTRGFTHTIKVL